MAGSVNKVILIGNLGADPEIRRTQDGRPIANLRIATYLEGALRTRKWQDKDGQDRYSTEVVLQGFNSSLTMLDGRGGGGAGAGASDSSEDFGSSGPSGAPARERKPAMAGAGKRDDMDDEIPF